MATGFLATGFFTAAGFFTTAFLATAFFANGFFTAALAAGFFAAAWGLALVLLECFVVFTASLLTVWRQVLEHPTPAAVCCTGPS